jgi:xanthine dehydrogenase FAD-binding subunit
LVKLGADKSTIDDIRLAFGVAAPTPMRATGAEDAVRGLPVKEAAEKIGELAQAETHPRDSWRASKDFRVQLIWRDVQAARLWRRRAREGLISNDNAHP